MPTPIGSRVQVQGFSGVPEIAEDLSIRLRSKQSIVDTLDQPERP